MGLSFLRYELRIVSMLTCWALFMFIHSASAAPANPKLAEIIEKAGKEGEIVYQAPDPDTGLPTGDMLRDMSGLAEKHFAVKIRVKIDNSLNFPASTAKALTEIKSGAFPSYDLMFQNVLSGIPLYENKVVEQIAWLEVLPHLTQKDLAWRGLVPIVDTQFILPIYNSRLVKPQDIPKGWEDILNPRWQGKLTMLVNHEPWALLSQPDAWGEEKALAYLKRLLELKPKLGRFPETFQRVLSGEATLSVTNQRERAIFYRDYRAAPLAVAEEVEPALAWVFILVVPKGARNRNAATLMAAALTTKEGQELQYKYRHTTSMFRPGTVAADFAAKHKVLVPDLDFVSRKEYRELTKKISSLLVQR